MRKATAQSDSASQPLLTFTRTWKCEHVPMEDGAACACMLLVYMSNQHAQPTVVLYIKHWLVATCACRPACSACSASLAPALRHVTP